MDNLKNHVENVHPEPEWNSGSETEDDQSEKEPLNTSPEEDVNEEDKGQ